MIPPRLPCPPVGSTRASRAARAAWHPYKFLQPLHYRSLDNALRAFPFGVIDLWNSLPAWFFDNGFDFKYLQTFKVRVHKFLGGKAVYNPALVKLRANDLRRGSQAYRAANNGGDVHAMPAERLNMGFVVPRGGYEARAFVDLKHA